MNSIAKRLDALLDFLDKKSVDVALLQELKTPVERFPLATMQEVGWKVAFVAEKGYNGVAVLSRDKNMLVRRTALPQASGYNKKNTSAETQQLLEASNRDDSQARYLEVLTHGIVVASIYAPNGNPIRDDVHNGAHNDAHNDDSHADDNLSEKFRYKLAWMERLYLHVEHNLLPEGRAFLLGGDFNVCPLASDVFDEQIMGDDALVHVESRRSYKRLINSGLVDAYPAFRVKTKTSSNIKDNGYTYWDYRRTRFQRNEGLRIDMFLLSPYLSERLENCFVERSMRALENPSDHTPLCLDLQEVLQPYPHMDTHLHLQLNLHSNSQQKTTASPSNTSSDTSNDSQLERLEEETQASSKNQAAGDGLSVKKSIQKTLAM